ncbi:MAG: HAD hydrolase-like protein [Candidatus Aenigmarchaeota archaeon]|nr:HAD hydrolase-like protein [Candidatus Aenigmarchaeota archaeon]
MIVYRTIIFDLDETLVHTKPEFKVQVIKNTLDYLGIVSRYSMEDIERFWFGPDRNGTIERCFRTKPGNFWSAYARISEATLTTDYIEPYDDIRFLGTMKKDGYKMGVLTENSQKNAELETEVISKRIGCNPFDLVLSPYSNGFKPKPHPECLQECLRRLGADHDTAMFVGNGPEDVDVARNAGVMDCFIERGGHMFIIDPPPSISIKSLYELEQYL